MDWERYCMKYKLYSYTKKSSSKMVLISFGIISNKLFSIPVNALLVQVLAYFFQRKTWVPRMNNKQAKAHTHTRARAHTRTRAHTHTHTHTELSQQLYTFFV